MTRHSKRPERQARHPLRRRGGSAARVATAPVLSDHYLIGWLHEQGRPLCADEIVAALHVTERAGLDSLLAELVAAGRVVRNRRGAFGLPERMDLIHGRVHASAEGHGHVVPDEGEPWLYLSPREMRQVMHGDRILCSITGLDRRGRPTAQIVEVLERAVSKVVGRYLERGGVAFVVPDDPRLGFDVVLPGTAAPRPSPGQIVVARIVEPPQDGAPPVGVLERVLGEAGTPGMAAEIAIHSHDLPYEWPPEVLSEIAGLPDDPGPADLAGREDLQALPLVTIDGPEARDFDDAVYCAPAGSGWRLIVAIADVAYYVRPGSALDAAARRRGTSVYFPNRVLPMLPEVLSNGLCSLKPERPRLALVCDMQIDRHGEVEASRFYRAVIRSHARLTYQDVERFIAVPETGQGRAADGGDKVGASLSAFHRLWQAFDRQRRRRGGLDFDTREAKILFAEDGEVADVVVAERLIAHRMIEEAMITANVCAARTLLAAEIPALYRVHHPPPPVKLETLVPFLRAQGLKPGWQKTPAPADFAALADVVRDRPNHQLVHAMLLRAQALAVYLPQNEGHFGLALDAYCHFTSPIRRYPDLLVHRALLQHIGGRAAGVVSAEGLGDLAEHCSFTERRAEEAERQVKQRLLCVYLKGRVGEVFSGMVSGVAGFGLFVELAEPPASGLVHISTLPGDYYHFDPLAQHLKGERRGRVYRLGDAVRVRLAAVRLEDDKIDLELLEPV